MERCVRKGRVVEPTMKKRVSYLFTVLYMVLVLTPVLAHDRPREVSSCDALADVASRRVGAY